GAARPTRAAHSAWSAIGMMSIWGGVLMLVFLAVPRQLFGFFTRDPDVIAQGATYLRILALCQIATGAEGVVSGAFSGAGATVPLHVFEPRYREMTGAALQRKRLMAIARLRPGYQHDYEGRPPVFDVAGVGFVVAADELSDGRYNLVLRGVGASRSTPSCRR